MDILLLKIRVREANLQTADASGIGWNKKCYQEANIKFLIQLCSSRDESELNGEKVGFDMMKVDFLSYYICYIQAQYLDLHVSSLSSWVRT